jgi:phage head maturation protease
MIFEKAHFDLDGSNLRFAVPIVKVDRESRTISGFATLDNIDKQGDVVSTQASLEAFQEFRGNLREMHQAKAVGRVLAFSVEEMYDPVDEKMYSGIFVTAYISKGAADTWEKVLDGTLSGFSIGGEIHEADNVFDKSADKTIRVITKYSLIELSVVDNPANQLANILSIVKVDGGMAMKGMVSEIETESVFWCGKDEIAVTKDSDSASCPVCSSEMESIGWVERTDAEKAETVGALIKNHKGELTGEAHSEGGNEVSEETVVVEDVVEETVEAEAETVEEPVAEEVTEKAATVEETVEPEFDLEKALSEISESLLKTFNEKLAETAAATADQLAEFAKSVNEKFEAVAENLKTVADEVESTQKSLKEIDESSAVKKSADLGGDAEPKNNNNIWGSSFVVR